MTFDYLKQALAHLGKSHFQKTWPDESIKMAHLEMQDISETAIAATIKRIFVEISPSTFPALKRVVDIAKEEQIKVNLAKSPEEPKSRQFNDAHPLIDRKSIGSMGIDSLKLIDGLLDGRLTKENFIEGMMVFDKKYPRSGWSEQAGKLASHFSSQDRHEESNRFPDA